MRNQILSFAIAGLFLAGSFPALAQEHGHGHDWNRAQRIIGKTQEDLRRVEHHDAWAEVDRGHYDAAERNLADVRRDLGENRLDRRRLDDVISQVETISRINALNPRVRERLNEDVRELHRLRDDWRWQ
jgi:hypothetical protein